MIADIDLTMLHSAMGSLTAPIDGTVYASSDAELETLSGMKAITDSLFGCLPAQVG